MKPFLAAIPDGIIVCCYGAGYLEVKCPYNGKIKHRNWSICKSQGQFS